MVDKTRIRRCRNARWQRAGLNQTPTTVHRVRGHADNHRCWAVPGRDHDPPAAAGLGPLRIGVDPARLLEALPRAPAPASGRRLLPVVDAAQVPRVAGRRTSPWDARVVEADQLLNHALRPVVVAGSRSCVTVGASSGSQPPQMATQTRDRSRGSPAVGGCHGSAVQITAAAASAARRSSPPRDPTLLDLQPVDPLVEPEVDTRRFWPGDQGVDQVEVRPVRSWWSAAQSDCQVPPARPAFDRLGHRAPGRGGLRIAALPVGAPRTAHAGQVGDRRSPRPRSATVCSCRIPARTGPVELPPLWPLM